MGQSQSIDPALALNQRAHAEGWPFHCDTVLAFDRPELNALRDVWRSLAAGKSAPSRTDFDARMLKPFLRNISIIERVFVDAAKWRYRTRLTGSAIVELTGEHTGKYLDEHMPRDFLPRWIAPFDAVLDSVVPFRFVSEFALPHLSYLDGESLVAPLADTRGEVTLILTCLYFRPRRGPDAAPPAD